MESRERVGANSVTAPLNNSQESDVATNMTSGEGEDEDQEDDGENDDNLGGENQIGSKRKFTSDVWIHFERFVKDETRYAKCIHCQRVLKCPSTFGTTSLRNHYNKACKSRPRKRDIRQSVLMMSKKASGDSSEELTTHVFNQEGSRRELANMVILHDYPLSIVDHVGFRRYSSSLQPCFNMISRNTLKSDILKVYGDEKAKCYKLVSKLKSRIAITTDMWTSDSSKKGYMAITGHFIDDSWILRNILLRFVYVPAPHTAEVMAVILVESFMAWNIEQKVSSITVDNCSTNDAMLKAIPGKLPKKNFLLDGKVLHMRCCAHILNLIVREGLGLEVINVAIGRIRESVVYWNGSPARVEHFQFAAEQVGVDCSKMLSLDVKTRWNSTYLMLETAIKYRDVFYRLSWQDKNYKSLPSIEEWENAIELCGKLKLFYRVTEMFSGTLYPTSNFYFPRICDIKMEINKCLVSPKPVVKLMAEKMAEKFDKYWNDSHVLMGVAAVLDPRFKMKLVEFYIPLIYGENSDSKLHEIRQNCYDLLADYQSRSLSENLGDNYLAISSPDVSSTIIDPVESDTLHMYDKFVASNSSSSSSLPKTTEFDIYLDEGVLPRAQNFDILSWWKTNGVKYPCLQKMARDILAIPVSTVASESAFSDSGRLISPHRSRLHPTTIEALMCSRRWLWNEEKGSSLSIDPLLPSLLDEEEDDE